MSVGAVTNAESKISELTEYSFHPNSVDPLEFTRHAKGVYRKKINRKTITEEERAQILWEEAVITVDEETSVYIYDGMTSRGKYAAKCRIATGFNIQFPVKLVDMGSSNYIVNRLFYVAHTQS